ncbi:MAG: DUF2892 domain-containing protein [Roseobacter sp.]
MNAAFIGDCKMRVNTGNADHIFRALSGIVLLAALVVSGLEVFTGTIAIVISVVVAFVLLSASAVKFCPLYGIFSSRTSKL